MKKILPAVIGLGYVGLPIFIRLNRKFRCVGFDINENRIEELKKLRDYNKEFKSIDLKGKNGSIYSNKISDLKR